MTTGHRFLTRTLVFTALVPLATATVSLASGCGDDLSESGTAGARVALGTRVMPGDDLSLPVTTSRGWSITFARVAVSTGAMYYFDGDPPDLARRLPRWLTIPVAHAHPGHYHAGNAMGQMLEPASFDLMQGATSLAKGEGVTGPYRSASLYFHTPAEGELAGVLGSNAIVVEGEASKDGEARAFRASATKGDVTNANGNPAVEGCVFTPAEVDGDGTVVLRVNPSVWLDQVDFGELPEGSGQYVDLPAGGAAHQAFTLLGITRASAYSFSFEGE